MNLFRKIEDPVLGRLSKGFGNKWKGYLQVGKGSYYFIIDTQRNDPGEDLLAPIRYLSTHFGSFQQDLIPELFDDYQMFRQFDLDAGVPESDYDSYPVVSTVDDIWPITSIHRFRFGDLISRDVGNSYIQVDFDWPHSHCLQIFFNLLNSSWEFTHVELA